MVESKHVSCDAQCWADKKLLDKDEANENRPVQRLPSLHCCIKQTGTNTLTRVWGCNYIFNITNKMHIYSEIHVLLSTLPYVLIKKPTRCTNFWNLFWNETICFGQFFCTPSGVFHSTHRNGVCRTVLLTACEQDQDVVLILLPSCMTHTPLLCVQWKTPDDGQRNCPKHAEFHSKINLKN